jgi:hypothetical protein
VWYVDSQTGNNGYSGRNRNAPFATLAAALAEASAGDIIVCLDGHSETYTASVTIGTSVTIVGEGSSSGVPTVSFRLNAATGGMFSVTAANVSFRGIKFRSNSQETDADRITVTGAAFSMRNCYVEMGNFDTSNAALQISTGAAHMRLLSTTFISTATALATLPDAAVKGGAVAGLIMDGVVFSGGTYGFEEYAFEGQSLTSVFAENISLLLGADMQLLTETVGFVNVQTATGGARVDDSHT